MAECRFCAGSGCTACRNSGREGTTYQVGTLLDFRGTDIEVAGLPAAHLEADRLMGLELEGGPVQDGNAQNDDLAQIRWQAGLVAHGGQHPLPARGNRAGVQQHPVEQRDASAFSQNARLDPGEIRARSRLDQRNADVFSSHGFLIPP